MSGASRKTKAMLSASMPDLRNAINEELDRRKWSIYKLVQELKGKRPNGDDVPSVTVYRFLTGDSDINSTDLGIMLDVLGLWKRK